MEPLTFREIAALLNHSRTTRISEEPFEQVSGSWGLYNGEHRVHTDSIKFEVLYLHSNATTDALRNVGKRFKPNQTHVVYAPSLDNRTKLHHDLFKLKAKGFWNTTGYLASFFREELDAYNQKLIARAPKYYVEPRFEVPSGATRKIPNPIQAFLEDVAAASETAPGWLGVLLAGPGQGKTFTSEYLVSKMAQSKKLFPIYINSDQWRTIAPDDFGNLQKTIIHSFRHFETPIGWLEGCEEEFLMVTLKARLFRIVFDGFDEYVLRNQGRVSAPETLRALAKFVEVTGTRIAVTSRTSFWNSEIENVEEYLEGARLSVYTQLPFNTGQAKNYFSDRLEDPKSVERATLLYDSLRKQDEEFVGRGFVLRSC